MSVSKQLPLLQKASAYVNRNVNSLNFLSSAIPMHMNGYFEMNRDTVDNSAKVSFCKRPGVSDFEYITGKTNFKTTNAAERIMGLCTSLSKNNVIYITQDATKRYSNFYTLATNTLTQTDISATFTAGEYSLTVLDGINYGSNVFYAANNGTTGGLIDSAGAWSKITDADFTGTGTKTNFVGIDGYLFYGVISGTGAGRIYNSDLSAAAVAGGWTATSFLSASDVPGNIVWLGRIRNYLVCFKQFSIEFFEDVGNPTPGSPLEPRKQLTKKIGCASASSIQEVGDGIIFLGVDSNGKAGIFKIKQDSLEVQKISDSIIDANLQNFQTNIGGYPTFSNDPLNVSSAARGQSQVIIFQNKELYTIVAYSVFLGNPLSLVYDNELDFWCIWATNFSNATNDRTFVPTMSFLLNNNNGGYYTCFANNFATNTKSRFSVFAPIDATTTPYWFQDQYELAITHIYDFVFVWVSDLFDFGTMDRKLLHSLELIYDTDLSSFASTGSVSGTLSLYLFKNDFIKLSAQIDKTIDNNTFGRAKWNALGSFRRIGFVIYNQMNSPMRLWAAQVTYSNGIAHA